MRHQAQFFLIDRVQPLGTAAQCHVQAARVVSDFAQGWLIEFCSNHLAGGVANKVTSAVGEMQWNSGALGASNAHRIDRHPVFSGCFGRLERRAFEVLAVGQENQHAVVVAALVKQSLGFFDSASQIGALARDDVGVQCVQ